MVTREEAKCTGKRHAPLWESFKIFHRWRIGCKAFYPNQTATVAVVAHIRFFEELPGLPRGAQDQDSRFATVVALPLDFQRSSKHTFICPSKNYKTTFTHNLKAQVENLTYTASGNRPATARRHQKKTKIRNEGCAW